MRLAFIKKQTNKQNKRRMITSPFEYCTTRLALHNQDFVTLSTQSKYGKVQ